MVHKILGWFLGYLRIYFRADGMERFINLCNHRGINLWQICPNTEKAEIYACISLRDYKKLRNIARKTKVWPRISERHGGPFVWMAMKKRYSFFLGLVLFFGLVFFFSGRIWSIQIAGEGYHTEESLRRFLHTISVHSGMKSSELVCGDLEEQIRKQYADIGWVSAKKSGSVLYLQVQEVRLLEEKEKSKPSHLVATNDGKIVKIVTRQGTAKVHAGDKVKKGAVLISGVVDIIGDNDTRLGTQFVRAEGTVVLEVKKKYVRELNTKYQKKQYTGAEKKIYQWKIGENQFFFHNPLNYLETGRKYDIIREGGVVYPFLSDYLSLEFWKSTYREIRYQTKEYSEQEAKEVLLLQLQRYLHQKQEEGLLLQKSSPKIYKKGDTYLCEDQIVWWKEQKKEKLISKKTIRAKRKRAKRKQDNGDNGDGD